MRSAGPPLAYSVQPTLRAGAKPRANVCGVRPRRHAGLSAKPSQLAQASQKRALSSTHVAAALQLKAPHEAPPTGSVSLLIE